jgi:hydroxymethylbilane synthase
VPIGGHARLAGKIVELSAMVASLDGRQLFRAAGAAPPEDAVGLGKRVAVELLNLGARKILDEVYGSAAAEPGGV